MIGFLFRILLVFLLNALALWAIQIHLFPEDFIIEGGKHAYIYVGVGFTLINFILRPILNTLALPFRFITLGISTLLVNALLLLILQKTINSLPDLETTVLITGIGTYIITGSLMGLVNTILHALGVE